MMAERVSTPPDADLAAMSCHDHGVERWEITRELATRLVAAQFPRWAHLPLAPVGLPGWDNVTFRLGERLSVRLPSAAGYVAQVEKEHQWLPFLAPRLPLPIPEPVARGDAGERVSVAVVGFRLAGGRPCSGRARRRPRQLRRGPRGLPRRTSQPSTRRTGRRPASTAPSVAHRSPSSTRRSPVRSRSLRAR